MEELPSLAFAHVLNRTTLKIIYGHCLPFKEVSVQMLPNSSLISDSEILVWCDVVNGAILQDSDRVHCWNREDLKGGLYEALYVIVWFVSSSHTALSITTSRLYCMEKTCKICAKWIKVVFIKDSVKHKLACLLAWFIYLFNYLFIYLLVSR